MKIIVSYICTQCFSVVNTLSLKMLSHLAFEHLTCPKGVRLGPKMFPYSVEAGDQRGDVSCLTTYSIPAVTVDLILVSRFLSQGFCSCFFFPECMWLEGDITRAIVLKPENRGLGRVSSPAWWPSL